jgi:hypothetical protein
MPRVDVAKIKAGNVIRPIEDHPDMELRVRLDPVPSGSGGVYLFRFFNHPGTMALAGKVMRVGHHPLTKAEAAEETNVDVSDPVDRVLNAPSPRISSEPNVEPGESVSPNDMSEPEIEQQTVMSSIHGQPPAVDVPLPVEDITEPEVVLPKAPLVTPEEVFPSLSPTGSDLATVVENSNVAEMTPFEPLEVNVHAVSGQTPPEDGETTTSDGGTTEESPQILTVTSSADKVAYTFYATAALCAVVGSTLGLMEQVTWPTGIWEVPVGIQFAISLVPTLVIELGGVATAALGDVRRQMGERAYGYRTMSAAVAIAAIGWQLGSHDFKWYGFAFAGLSAFAYTLYLLHSAARRRDALRRSKKMADLAPVYPLWLQIRQPRLIKRAKSLAQEHNLELFQSINAAREAERVERRRAAIAEAVEKRIRAVYRNPLQAEIAVQTYDMDEMARRIESQADYDAWAGMIGKGLQPVKDSPPERRPTPRPVAAKKTTSRAPRTRKPKETD